MAEDFVRGYKARRKKDLINNNNILLELRLKLKVFADL